MDVDAKLNRYRRFYAAPQPGSLLIATSFPGERHGSATDLRDYDFTRMSEHRRYWALVLDNLMVEIENRRGVDDDWMPGILLHYGFGAFGTPYCDTELTFTEDTCYMTPFVNDWSDMSRVSYSPDRFWSQVFIEAGRYFSGKARGAFGVVPYPNPSPLDVINLLRGNALFTDVFEFPETLHQALAWAVEASVAHARTVAAAIDNPWGGSLTFNTWIPSGQVLLEDAADLCSPRTYAIFGLPYTQKVLDALGGGYIHHHNLGRQQYRNMASLRGLHVLQISSDPNCRRTAEDLQFLLEAASQVALELEVSPAEVKAHIDDFARGRFILRAACESRDAAAELVAFVRERSAIA
jgi:hypothetical protein